MERSAALCVSWEQFHRDCRDLVARLAEAGRFDRLVAVTRGGLIPAGIVAREMGIRVVETISLASYDHDQGQGRVELLKDLAPAFAADGGAGLLVIDDLVDTGETACFLRARLPRAHLAALYAKPLGKPLLDTFVIAVPQETWVHFPWDLGVSFQPPMLGGR